jgi:hypothetical protein
VNATFQPGDRVKTQLRTGTVIAVVDIQGDPQCHVRWDNATDSWVWASYLERVATAAKEAA